MVFLYILFFFWWLYVLVKLLKRTDMRATDKIC
jgi:hypothetical protein